MMAELYKKLLGLRRIKRKIRWRVSAKPVFEEDLTRDLLAPKLLKAGDVVMVHSSLSSIGNVFGGAETVCRVFQKVLTESGTLLMPTYHQPEPILKMMMIKKDRLVDLRTAESTMGKLTETFRTMPGVKRSSHPFSSVSAWGRYSNQMTTGHDRSPYLCGPGSPFLQIIEMSGKYMGIGIDIRVIALYHVLEENWSEFPIRVHCPKPFNVRYIDPSGNRVERKLIILDPAVAKTRIDQEMAGAWIRKWLTNYMRGKGILHEFKLGQANSWIVDGKSFYDEMKLLAVRGITIYTTKVEFDAIKNEG
jgi:aminoglycoside 3-N-acetyltransferase